MRTSCLVLGSASLIQYHIQDNACVFFLPTRNQTESVAGAGVTAVSGLGLVIQLTSEMCEAFRLCLAQLLMCNMRLHQFEALRQMSSACVLFLCVGVWVLEWERFCQEQAWRRVIAHPHWYLAAGAQPVAGPA